MDVIQHSEASGNFLVADNRYWVYIGFWLNEFSSLAAKTFSDFSPALAIPENNFKCKIVMPSLHQKSFSSRRPWQQTPMREDNQVLNSKQAWSNR